MAELRFEHDRFVARGPGGEGDVAVTPEDVAGFRDWAARYEKVLRLYGGGDKPEAQRLAEAAATLRDIGRAMRAWLDAKDLLAPLVPASGPIELVFGVPARPKPVEVAFLAAPWEVLADGHGRHLAEDDRRPFRPARRLGLAASAPRPPLHQDLFLLFMAAAPSGVSDLDYEAEEALILRAVERLPMQVAVEESGALDFLADRMAREEIVEALHVSCHGDIEKDTKQGFLVLEDARGFRHNVTAGDLRGALLDRLPPLIFVSACRTAEQRASAVPLAIDLVGVGVANVVGWDGSVYDADAMAFAESFYRVLALCGPVPEAAATARRDLLRRLCDKPQDSIGRHWHLARVTLGPEGGGALCAAGLPRRRLRNRIGEKEFLDGRGQVPVAAADVFVGRRREAQAVLRVFRDGGTAGVVLHGIGRLGKSSLAARIASRLIHHQTVVVFGDYRGVAIFDRLVEALHPEHRDDMVSRWRARIMADASGERVLKDAIEAILTGPARCHDPAQSLRPVLLVIDDLERILEVPRQGDNRTLVQQGFRAPLRAVIAAFAATRGDTESRLILTSRYLFALPDRQGDAAAALFDLQLPPLTGRQAGKLLQAETRGAASGAGDAPAMRTALTQRAVAVAAGHPGLQSLLTRAILTDAKAAEGAVAAAESFKAQGTIPEGGDLGQFFIELTLKHYRDALTALETAQLRAAFAFALPVPQAALAAAGAALAVPDPARAIDRLLGLGCLDALRSDAGTDDTVDLAANALARPLFAALDPADIVRIARAAVPVLAAAWRDVMTIVRGNPFAEDLLRLARLAGDAPAIFIEAAAPVAAWRFNKNHDARGALDIVLEALRMADQHRLMPSAWLLRIGAEAAERLGEVAIQDDCLGRGLERVDDDAAGQAKLWGRYGERLVQKGEIDAAETWFRRAAGVFVRLGDASARAVTLGQIADVLQQRGETDEALRIRREDCLPVYERLGDARSRAVTMGKIANVLQQRGEWDEALRIRREEELPVYERLGDARERAVTLGQIADVLQRRGDSEEALRIRREEELPVYERLGDARSRAVTMGKIADVLQARGDTDEALRIYREEGLPVYERLGDARSRAVTLGQIADVLQQRGETDEALRIRREDCLPVFERLGDASARAVTLGQIADVLQQRGEMEEALRIHREERLPVAERMGDKDGIAASLFKIAAIRLNQGIEDAATLESVLDDLARAFTMALELGRPDAIAAIGWTFGQVLVEIGQTEAALAVLSHAAAAERKLGRTSDAEVTETLIAKLRGGEAAPPA